MLGDRDVRGAIIKAIDKAYGELDKEKRNTDPEIINVAEASTCIRLSYYERKDSNPSDTLTKMSFLAKYGIKNLFNPIHGEFVADNLKLEVTADLILEKEYVVNIQMVTELPTIPHPRDLLYTNACLFAFDKIDGILIYATVEGNTTEFSITKNNKMFEEIVRRARVLSTLLKENKVPIVEPCELCLQCKYYERCYAREK